MSDTLSGFLLWTEPSAHGNMIAELPTLRDQTEFVEGWHRYDYLTREQIPKVEGQGPPFSHLLLVRWGRGRLILLSNNYRICDYFINHELRPSLPIFLKKATIAVHTLVLVMTEFRQVAGRLGSDHGASDALPRPPNGDLRDWQEFNSSHNLGYASGRTDAFGGNLRKIDFEGDDLASVPLFTSSFPVITFRACGLRRKVLDESGVYNSYELMTLGRTGFISFPSPTSINARRQRFKEVEMLLRSINRWGFVK